MLGESSSSPNTYTPGASNARVISSTAACPLAVLASNKNCSSCLQLVELQHSSIVKKSERYIGMYHVIKLVIVLFNAHRWQLKQRYID